MIERGDIVPLAVAPRLHELVGSGGSDLHLRAGAAPSIRVNDGVGRVATSEIAVNTGLMAQAIVDPLKTATIPDLAAHGGYHGMHSFHQDLVRLLGQGTITWQAARAAATDPHDLEVEVRRARLLDVTMSG